MIGSALTVIATIAINQSIAGISLSSTSKNVEDRFGKPTTTMKIATYNKVDLVRHTYAQARLNCFFLGDRLVRIVTTDEKEKSPEQVAVGMTEAELVKRLPAADCGYRGQRSCDIASTNDKVRTRFYIAAGKITAISLEEVVE